MCSVGTAECIHYKYIRQRSQFLAEFFAVLGFLCTTESGVFQNDDFAILHCIYSSLYAVIYHFVRRYKCNLCRNQFCQTVSSCLQRELCLRTILRLAQMRAKNHLTAFGNELVNRRQCSLNPVVVGNHAIFHRYVKVYPYKHPLALYINIVYCYFVQTCHFLTSFHDKCKPLQCHCTVLFYFTLFYCNLQALIQIF